MYTFCEAKLVVGQSLPRQSSQVVVLVDATGLSKLFSGAPRNSNKAENLGQSNGMLFVFLRICGGNTA